MVDPHMARSPSVAATSAAIRSQHISLALLAGLIALIIAWQLASSVTPRSVGIGLALSLPLWLPLRGISRANRRSFAWATLCVIPYFVIGTTEAVANPVARVWAGACLALSLALFVTLIAYLRLTRPVVVAGADLGSER